MNGKGLLARRVIIIVLLSTVVLGSGCSLAAAFDRKLPAIVRQHTFSIARWEFGAIPAAVREWARGGGDLAAGGTSTVTEYYTILARIHLLQFQIETGGGSDDLARWKAELAVLKALKAEMAGAVEWIIAGQIRETLAEQGIYNPLTGAEIGFPPLNFTLEAPPHLLVVSPRDRIESIREVTLKPDITVAVVEGIEAEVERLGVSSLVVELGGFGGTFPTLVTDKGDLRFTIETAVEEWVHQYLNFTPLGFRYLLDTTGVSPDYEIATMNETVAGMVSDEIGSLVLARYYPEKVGGQTETNEEFNREMREIRRAVDAYLAAGEIDNAEEYMEERRQYLVGRGYYLRKLNQAYFAFHGTYADSPTSIDPIGAEFRELRAQSASIGDFLRRAARMTGRHDLQQSLIRNGG